MCFFYQQLPLWKPFCWLSRPEGLLRPPALQLFEPRVVQEEMGRFGAVRGELWEVRAVGGALREVVRCCHLFL